MVDALFNDPVYIAGKKNLDAIALRQEAIATNVANLETPGYKRVDLAPSFSTALEKACASGDMQQMAALQPSLAPDATAVANSKDGNTVKLDNEMLEMNKNMLAHAVETQLVTNSLARLRMAMGK